MMEGTDGFAEEIAPTVKYDGTPPSATHQVWEWMCWTASKTYDGLDFAGEVLANFLGLTQSEYQWMIDLKEREQEEKRRRRLEARQRRQLRLEQLLEEEKRKLMELEQGVDLYNDSIEGNESEITALSS